MLTGCKEDEQQQQLLQEKTSAVADIAFAVTRSNQSTRMSSAVVQAEGEAYRSIEMQRIVPFAVAGKIGSDDMPKAFQIFGTGSKPVDSQAYYYYENCELMAGVCSFLCYGRAPRISVDKAVNGSIVETFPADMAPKDTRFSLEPIATGIHPTASALAAYMTDIANAKGNGVSWKDAPNATLSIMYLNFIHRMETEGDGDVLPGSASNVKAFTQALKTQLNQLSLTGDDDAIREAIITETDKYNEEWDGFPANIGLPDGAAVIRWTGTAFQPQITTTTLADINGIDRFAYPAEIYYYCNSRIYTSTTGKHEDSYTNRAWSEVLSDYEYPNGTVSSNTTAIAIKDPMQYGVAHAQIILKKTDNATLTDAKGTSVTVGATSFPLTGIIIGGQLPVGFDFAPTSTYPVYSEADMKFVYDSQVKTNGASNNEYFYLSSSNDAAQATNTLVLQSYDHKKVPVVLEFLNGSNTDFIGLEGIVYRNTRFYLAGELDPEDFKTDPRSDIRDRVFTQDYTTKLNMKVTGLGKAYNVVPNLLSPRLELGIQLVPKWVATTPDEILF